MAKHIYTDDETEVEIKKLQESYEVKLAKKEERIRIARRQYLYSLRTYAKKGRELMKQGYTLDNIEESFDDEDDF